MDKQKSDIQTGQFADTLIIFIYIPKNLLHQLELSESKINCNPINFNLQWNYFTSDDNIQFSSDFFSFVSGLKLKLIESGDNYRYFSL